MTNPEHSSEPSRRSRLRRRGFLLAGAAGLALVTAGAVHAHWDRGGWRGSPSDGRFERQARFQRFCSNDTARYQPVVRAFVRADLRLDANQAAEFDKLADQVLPALEELKAQACNDFVGRGGPTPERIAHLAAVLRKAADTAEKAVEPSRRFYGSLDERQKERVDELANRRGRFGPR
jgi:hypothetical protein